MHLALVLSFAYTFFLPFPLFLGVKAIHPFVLSRQAHNSSELGAPLATTSRQHLSPRALIDICASVDLGLLANTKGLLGLELFTESNLCLCLRDLDLYLETNLKLKLLTSLIGRDALITTLTALINTSPTQQACTLPSHAHHTCSNEDVCHYQCGENYVRSGNSCVCPLPLSTCNGICGHFPGGCASPVPHYARAEITYVKSEVRTTCRNHETVCKIPGRGGISAYECIDTKATTHSCGGCTAQKQGTDDAGVDCHKIPHVEKVSCAESRCVVEACVRGWIPSPQRDACIVGFRSSRRITRAMVREIPQDIGDVEDSQNATRTTHEFVYERILGRSPSPSCAFAHPELNKGLATVVKLVIDLEVNYSSPPVTSGSSISDVTLYTDLLSSVLSSLQAVLASPTVVDLVSSIDRLLDAAKALEASLGVCGCVTEANMDLAGQLVKVILDVQQWCNTHPIAYVPSQTFPGTGAIGYGPITDHTLPGLPSPPPTPTVTPSQDQGCPVPTVSTVPNSSRIPIVLGLNKLLASLGLGSLKAVATVDGLGNDFSSAVNGLLDQLNIGPHGVRKRGASGGYGVDQDKDLSLLLSTMTKLAIDLGGTAEISLIDGASVSGTCVSPPSASAHTPTTIITPSPVPPSQPVYPVDSGGSIDLFLGLVAEVLSSTTLGSLVLNLDSLLEASSQIQAQSGYPLLDILVKITEAALQLRGLCLEYGTSLVDTGSSSTNSISFSPTPTSSGNSAADCSSLPAAGGDTPVIISFNGLLAGLGLATLKADAQVTGLGNGLGASVNGLLDGLGIGPAGLRKRD